MPNKLVFDNKNTGTRENFVSGTSSNSYIGDKGSAIINDGKGRFWVVPPAVADPIGEIGFGAFAILGAILHIGCLIFALVRIRYSLPIPIVMSAVGVILLFLTAGTRYSQAFKMIYNGLFFCAWSLTCFSVTDIIKTDGSANAAAITLFAWLSMLLIIAGFSVGMYDEDHHVHSSILISFDLVGGIGMWLFSMFPDRIETIPYYILAGFTAIGLIELLIVYIHFKISK